MLIPTSASSQAGEKWNPKELCKKLESLWLKKKKIKKKKAEQEIPALGVMEFWGAEIS